MSEPPQSVLYYDLFKKTFISSYSNIFGGSKGDGCISDAKRVRKYAHSIFSTITQVKPLPDLENIIELLSRHVSNNLPANPTNMQFSKWLHAFKEEYVNTIGGGMRPVDEKVDSRHGLVLRLCGGSNNNRNHIYRSKCIWEILVLVELVTSGNDTRLPLRKLLPGVDQFTDPLNSNWKIFLTPFAMQMYLFKVRGEIARFDRCSVVGDIYKSFEYEAGGESEHHDEMTSLGHPDRVNVPPQTLDFKVLQIIMPDTDAMFSVSDDVFKYEIDRWKAKIKGSIVSRLKMFPFLPLSQECCWVYKAPSGFLGGIRSSEDEPRTEIPEAEIPPCRISRTSTRVGESGESSTENAGITETQNPPYQTSRDSTQIDESSKLETIEISEAEISPCHTPRTSTHVGELGEVSGGNTESSVNTGTNIHAHHPLSIHDSDSMYLLVLFQYSSVFYFVLLFQFILFMERHWE
eukprot:TRINITY_DN30855_c0_g1_i1.p1 TRINITY_DN30855_c0_g1~~TRINITY_DN30855_c0_g1_i1.p1  ORF type:complete len:479 (+),score=49.38 TRINITY_DN30855_c0_g1_i1:57-1439(+)